jgi:hypothetical protein
MARLSDRARWAVILGAYVGYQFLRGVARANPALAPWLWPLLAVYLTCVLLTWFAYPLFNLILRFNKFGRYALSRDQRIASNWFCACLVVFLIAVTAKLGWDAPLSIGVAFFSVGIALPLVMIFQCDVGWPRRMMSLFTIGMAAVGLVALASDFFDFGIGYPLVIVFVAGFVAAPLLANYLMRATTMR